MAARTHGERIEVAEKEVLRHGFQIESLEERFRTDVVVLKAQIRVLEEKAMESVAKAALTEQRCNQLEKLLDEGRTRRWQVWLAVLGAILSATIALIVALVKK